MRNIALAATPVLLCARVLTGKAAVRPGVRHASLRDKWPDKFNASDCLRPDDAYTCDFIFPPYRGIIQPPVCLLP